MTCRDLLFNVLYRADIPLMCAIVRDSLDRLQDEQWRRDQLDRLPLDSLRCLFFLLLNRDLTLKELALEGIGPTIPPLCRRKAQAFYLALDSEVVRPFLVDHRRTTRDLLDAIKHCYLSV